MKALCAPARTTLPMPQTPSAATQCSKNPSTNEKPLFHSHGKLGPPLPRLAAAVILHLASVLFTVLLTGTQKGDTNAMFYGVVCCFGRVRALQPERRVLIKVLQSSYQFQSLAFLEMFCETKLPTEENPPLQIRIKLNARHLFRFA